MQTQHIPLQETGRFSQLICDYLSQKKGLQDFYSQYPDLENFQEAMDRKRVHFSKDTRSVLVDVLQEQYTAVEMTKAVSNNLELLAKKKHLYDNHGPPALFDDRSFVFYL